MILVKQIIAHRSVAPRLFLVIVYLIKTLESVDLIGWLLTGFHAFRLGRHICGQFGGQYKIPDDYVLQRY